MILSALGLSPNIFDFGFTPKDLILMEMFPFFINPRSFSLSGPEFHGAVAEIIFWGLL